MAIVFLSLTGIAQKVMAGFFLNLALGNKLIVAREEFNKLKNMERQQHALY